MFIVFFVCRFLCIYRKKMRRKMFIKNIVYKKWYIVFCAYIIFCVYMIFIILCKKTLTSRNAQNFLRAKIFYTFFIFMRIHAQFLCAKNFIFQQNSNNFNTKNKKITQNCEQPPNRTAKSAKAL